MTDINAMIAIGVLIVASALLLLALVEMRSPP
jgi:hypothetical protein